MKRREFLTTAGLAIAAGAVLPSLEGCSNTSNIVSKKNIVRSHETQVLVIGGGCAGVCAAIAAAREGARVMIAERYGCLGGMATAGLVSPFMTSFDTTGETQVIRGIFDEIVCRLEKLGGAIHPSKVHHTSPYSAWITAGHDHVTPFDAEILKYVLDQMCAEAGVKVLLHVAFVEPVVSRGKIRGAVLVGKKGYESVSADVVIDASGDGDVAVACGVPYTVGNPETGRIQPATLFFRINNVNSRVLEADIVAHLPQFRKVNGVSYRALHWCVEKAEAAGEWDISRKSVNIYKCVKDDEWAVNCTRIKNVDACDPESMSAAEVEGRRQVQEMMNFFHKYVPGCENATLMTTGFVMGIRESRHIEGEHTLTVDEILQGVVPSDSVFVASNSVDVHGRNGDNSTEYKTVENGRWYGVPYGCLVPKGIKGLLVAGRSLSATSDAAGAVRVMPPCMAMGQAAGIAAALAVKGGVTPGEISREVLRERLLAQGVFLG